MSFAHDLTATIRGALRNKAGVSEKRMFGGICFMLNGNMLVGASKRGLLARVGKDRQDEALAWPASRMMEMRGRVMEGYVYLDPEGASDEAVKACLRLALEHVKTLPKKAAEKKT